MPYMTDRQPTDHVLPLHDTPADSRPVGEMTYCIPRVGSRPLEFTGVELGMAMSFNPELPWWYEFNIFRTDAGFVVSIKRFHVAEDETDYCRAWQFPDLDAAMAALESYDAAQDVSVSRHMPPTDATAAELAATAFQLRAEIAETRAHFASLVGEFLHDLEQA
uniref:DUF402 domain-containing protein n=2 Tax=Alloyangia mangrovi TaxID=1779329 RepID=A0A2A3K1S6_9RHOB